MACFGGAGHDYISYYSSTNGTKIDLQNNTASRSWAYNDDIRDFERASGSRTGDDVMLGANGYNLLRGNGGDDKLYGRGGADVVFDFGDDGMLTVERTTIGRLQNDLEIV